MKLIEPPLRYHALRAGCEPLIKVWYNTEIEGI
jgi:hypothetical protein